MGCRWGGGRERVCGGPVGCVGEVSRLGCGWEGGRERVCEVTVGGFGEVRKLGCGWGGGRERELNQMRNVSEGKVEG